MPRKIKDRSSIHIGLSDEERLQLEAVSADTGLSQYQIIKRAIMAYNPHRTFATLERLEGKLDELLKKEGK